MRARVSFASLIHILIAACAVSAAASVHAQETASSPTGAPAGEATPSPPMAAESTAAPVVAPPPPTPEPAPPPASPPAPVDPKANFHETGRIGVLGAITEDGWKGGVIYEYEYFEAQILAHAEYESKDSHDIRLSYKLGGRVPLGTLNYLAFGAEFGHHPSGKIDGVSVSHDFLVGPYVSLQRYFAATPVMLNLWVNPVEYDHAVDVEDGRAVTNVAWRIFQTGGFGIGYIF
jgi:hypothetical protein